METITPARFDLKRNVTRANANQTKLLMAAFAQSDNPSAKVIEELRVQTGLYDSYSITFPFLLTFFLDLAHAKKVREMD